MLEELMLLPLIQELERVSLILENKLTPLLAENCWPHLANHFKLRTVYAQ